MKKELIWFIVTLTIGSFLLIGFRVYGVGGDASIKYIHNSEIHDNEKHRGAHVFGYLDSMNIQPFVANNFDWITIVPYGNQREHDSPEIRYFRKDRLQQLKRDSMWASQIKIAHDAGMKVFIKPHIWISNHSNGKWRSDIYPTNDENWESWKEAYRKFIMLYAHLAERNNVEMFCIGAEFTSLSANKSEFWEELIKDVRAVYSGKLTYAANWYKEYEKVPFWDQLDYIGVQAYFPLVKNEYPSVDQLSKGWKKHVSALENVHEKYNKPILFTELGYKSTADSGIKPWEWIDYSAKEDKPHSIETQVNCYNAFFDTVWDKEWFAGVHIWQMRSEYKNRSGREDSNFTPQGKITEKVIADRFRKDTIYR